MHSEYLSFIKKNTLNATDKNDKTDIFLKKYKGFKINDFPLPSNFNKVNLKERLLMLESNVSSVKYTLNEKNIGLIYLINELRGNNNMNKLIGDKIENLNYLFREKNSNDDKCLFTYALGEFRNKLLTNDEKITKILFIEELKLYYGFRKRKK